MMSGIAAKKHIIVAGAGPGGLTAAMILAYRGFKVTVFEARQRVGGRNACMEVGPYRFDIGPTFLMLKAILDEVFQEAGVDADELLDCKRLEPMYRLQFGERRIEPTTDPERMQEAIKRCFPGQEKGYNRFILREKDRFARLFPCLQKPYSRVSQMFAPSMLGVLPHLAPGKTLYDVMRNYFGDEELALSFTFQSKYLGMSPWSCPGLFAMIPYIEHAFGIYHVNGGLSRISDVMADVLRETGGEIHLDTPVSEILVENGAARGVRLANGETMRGDTVIINADFGHAMQKLVAPHNLRKYKPARLKRMRLSCSTVMLYLGLDTVYDLPHHTIVFAADYRRNLQNIMEGKRVGSDISFYVRQAGVTDTTLAPAGHTALYVLVPVANLRGETDWTAETPSFRETVLDALENRVPLPGLRRHIKEERMLNPLDWRDEFNVFEGATFNLAHNLTQMLYLRPHNRFEEFDNCYLVGGGTHPGSGLPTIYESGRIAANMISREYNIPFVSKNLEV